MAENSGHAPGNEISGQGGAIRQRQRMGRGDGPMSGDNFGVGPLPGTAIRGNHGSHSDDGATLDDSSRAGPPAIGLGEGRMGATAHSYHGPHGH